MFENVFAETFSNKKKIWQMFWGLQCPGAAGCGIANGYQGEPRVGAGKGGCREGWVPGERVGEGQKEVPRRGRRLECKCLARTGHGEEHRE